jgi:hypothetical protein
MPFYDNHYYSHIMARKSSTLLGQVVSVALEVAIPIVTQAVTAAISSYFSSDGNRSPRSRRRRPATKKVVTKKKTR